MLKIKDNVDLKELEKFGFVNTDGRYIGEHTIICKNRNVIGRSRYGNWSKMYAVEEMFDLIQAGLVEKV